MKFIGRNDIIEDMESLWRKRTASLVSCKGRRRIGKSRLIAEFAKRTAKRFIRIEGLPPRPGMDNRAQLDAFAKALSRETKSERVCFDSWHDAFLSLFSKVRKGERTVVLLDEISWMGAYDADFPGYLKMAWDEFVDPDLNLIVFLCGSVSAWIERNILGSTGFVGRLSRNYTIGELSPCECLGFWGRKAPRLQPGEILDVLSVCGGIPKYLEEIDPSLSADENIRRLCFTDTGTLFGDFKDIFSGVFGEGAAQKRRILELLADRSLNLSELSKALKVAPNGHLAEALSELSLSGFITPAEGLNPATGRQSRTGHYRLRDNYTRFYLHYILPNERAIKSGTFRFTSMEGLPGWSAIMGLQFENLVLNNATRLLPLLGIGNSVVRSISPYRNERNSRRGGCQVDLLIQTQRTAYVVEVKRRREIGAEVEAEVEEKIRRIPFGRGMSVRTALVYDGHLDPAVEGGGFFDALIPSSELLKI